MMFKITKHHKSKIAIGNVKFLKDGEVKRSAVYFDSFAGDLIVRSNQTRLMDMDDFTLYHLDPDSNKTTVYKKVDIVDSVIKTITEKLLIGSIVVENIGTIPVAYYPFSDEFVVGGIRFTKDSDIIEFYETNVGSILGTNVYGGVR